MDLERKLVTIRTVSDLQPIEGADQIEVAHVDGWKCVVKKGDFKVGDLAVYFEIDSILPDRPEFEFMRHRRFRVRTVKLRGQVSQGLLMPILTIFPTEAVTHENGVEEVTYYSFESGMDVTERVGVVKYEVPLPPDLAARVRGNFPSFIPKTDQERCQNIVKELQALQGTHFEITEKLDGSSMTVYWENGNFGVCSRNLDLKEGDTPEESCTQWKVARAMDLEFKLTATGRNLALQGELVGEGVQKNRYGLKGQQFRIFDIYDIDDQRYLTSLERTLYIGMLDLTNSHVPLIHDDYVLEHSVEELLTMADGRTELYTLGGDGLPTRPLVKREGLVFKSKDLVKGNTFSFKAISNAFLLDEE